MAATPIPMNDASFTADEIAAATGGAPTGSVPASVRGVVTDSRRVVPGSLFVALAGDAHDGHRFVEDALRQGAAAALVSSGAAWSAPEGRGLWVVEDSLSALGALARLHRRRWGAPLVAITGSAGKTTTKELTAAALHADGTPVLKTAGNLNNLVGVPMMLLSLRPEHGRGVVELGTSRAGEIGRLAAMAEPDVGLVTCIAAAHTEGLGSVAAVAREKTALFDAVAAHGAVVFNADDPWQRAWRDAHPGARSVSFGRARDADVRLVEARLSPPGRTTVRIEERGGPARHGSLRLLGDVAALDATAALAAARALGIDLGLALDALGEVHPVEGRLFPRPGLLGSLVLDDTYNANPLSMEAALRAACDLAAPGRVVAVLGDMRELGALEDEAHRRIGELVRALGVRAFVACGTAMGAAAASAGGVDVVRAADARAAASSARALVRPGDVVLVKGSRSMAMERVVAALTTGGGEDA